MTTRELTEAQADLDAAGRRLAIIEQRRWQETGGRLPGRVWRPLLVPNAFLGMLLGGLFSLPSLGPVPWMRVAVVGGLMALLPVFVTLSKKMEAPYPGITLKVSKYVAAGLLPGLVMGTALVRVLFMPLPAR